MNWDAVGAIAESLGAVAVLATLVYLSVQVRHARAEQRNATLESRTDALREMHLSVATSPSLAAAFVKAEEGLDGYLEPYYAKRSKVSV